MHIVEYKTTRKDSVAFRGVYYDGVCYAVYVYFMFCGSGVCYTSPLRDGLFVA